MLTYRIKKPLWMAVVITLFAVIRYDTGWDYMSYYNACTDPTSLEVAKNSWGWVWAKWLDFVYDNNVPYIGIGVPAILTSIFLYYALVLLYDNKRKDISDALLVYSIWPFLYLQSFCIIRQSLAVSIMLLVIMLMIKKKFIAALLLFFINILIHPSSIMTVVFLPFVVTEKRRSVTWVIMGALFTIVAFAFAAYILEIIGLMRYMEYLETTDNFGGKISLVYAALAIYFLYFLSVNKDITSVPSKFTSLVTLGCILQFLVYVTDIPSVISRACAYTYIFLAPTLLYSLNQLGLRKLKPVTIALIVAFFFVYLYITQDSPNASSQYVPYKTIFSQL